MSFDARVGSEVVPGVFMNPGSGPVPDATEENAWANLAQFGRDLQERGYTVGEPRRVPSEDEAGRYSFLLPVNGVEHEIDMPGLPLEEVRWLDHESGNIWDFPRLYVDGSSWVWKYALQIGEE